VSSDLLSALPRLLPKAAAWAERQSADILANGVTLSEKGLVIAKAVGVSNPERVRVAFVVAMPVPEDAELAAASAAAGLLTPNTIGLTLGYGIYLLTSGPAITAQVLAHEARHVHQYEQAGSIPAFLAVYLPQVLELGYSSAPYELDAVSASEAYA
jgi:hypothetical protein